LSLQNSKLDFQTTNSLLIQPSQQMSIFNHPTLYLPPIKIHSQIINLSIFKLQLPLLHSPSPAIPQLHSFPLHPLFIIPLSAQNIIKRYCGKRDAEFFMMCILHIFSIALLLLLSTRLLFSFSFPPSRSAAFCPSIFLSLSTVIANFF
jgi:hypothetical protein